MTTLGEQDKRGEEVNQPKTYIYAMARTYDPEEEETFDPTKIEDKTHKTKKSDSGLCACATHKINKKAKKAKKSKNKKS